MSLPLLPLLSVSAIAFGCVLVALVLLLPRRSVAVGVAPSLGIAPTGRPKASARPAVRRAPKATASGWVSWLRRLAVLAGRPEREAVRSVVIGKTVLGGVVLLVALLWVALDPSTFRVAVGLFAFAVAFCTPELLLYSRGLERQKEVELALPDTLDQMTITVEAGLGFEAAMAKAAQNGRGPLAEELIRTLQDMSIGRNRRDAYQALAERTGSRDLRRFTRAVVQADEYGIAIADVLRVQAGEMRLRRRQRAEESAMKVPVKVLFPLLFCILPVLFIVILAPAALHTLRAFGFGGLA